MSSKNCELELYQLIMKPDEDISYVSEFGWVTDNKFFVWVDHIWFKEFMEKLYKIFGYGIFPHTKTGNQEKIV